MTVLGSIVILLGAYTAIIGLLKALFSQADSLPPRSQRPDRS